MSIKVLYEIAFIYALCEAVLTDWPQVTEDEIKVLLSALKDSSDDVRDELGWSVVDTTCMPWTTDEKVGIISTAFGISKELVKARLHPSQTDILTDLLSKALEEAKKETDGQ